MLALGVGDGGEQVDLSLCPVCKCCLNLSNSCLHSAHFGDQELDDSLEHFQGRGVPSCAPVGVGHGLVAPALSTSTSMAAFGTVDLLLVIARR